MECPRCHNADFVIARPCPRCGFQIQAAPLSELNRLDWLLAEMETWSDLPLVPGATQILRAHYLTLQRELQIQLGLRYPAFTEAEAAAAWPEYLRLEMLFQKIETWLADGLLKTGSLAREYARLLELRQRLEGYERPVYPQNNSQRLEVVDFMLKGIENLQLLGDFKSIQTVKELNSPFLAARARLSAPAQPPVPAPALTSDGFAPVVLVPVTNAPPVHAPVAAPAAPPAPRLPLRETLWRSILSERTLHALLFLGIFLLFTAAISFVIWGWKDFSAPVRVVIPSGFTVTFFLLGWLVRSKASSYRSGVAISAIAALFVPIDCYTVYANYGTPPQGWPDFWLWTSLACLIAYILSAFAIRSRFFGYITAVAIGSTLLAILEKFFQPLGLSRDWYYAALTVLAAGLNLLALDLEDSPEPQRWHFFTEPFRALGLLVPAVVMPLTLALRLLTRDSFDSLHYAMTLSWFIGAFLFGWGAVRYRSRGLGMLAAISLPFSVYMFQSALFFQTGTNPAWHAFGLACLTPIYLLSGYRLQRAAARPPEALPADPALPVPAAGADILLAHSQTALRWGVVLMLLAALLPLTDLSSGGAAAASHTVLMISAALAAGLWKQPRYSYFASLLSFTASTFAMSELKLPFEQLSVGWVSLALAHILLALAFNREKTRLYTGALVTCGYLSAVLAVLPPVFLDKRPLLVYVLGTWLALSGWGALLAWRKQPGFVRAEISSADDAQPVKAKRRANWFPSGAIFHWMAALPLPLWLWAVFSQSQPAGADFAFALAALAWAMVFLNHGLRILPAACRLPWRLVGLVSSFAAVLFIGTLDLSAYALALTLLAAGLLYFADTLASRQRWEFYPAGLVTAWGLLTWLNAANLASEFVALGLCALIALYFLCGLLAERLRLVKPGFLSPLYQTAHILTFGALSYIYLTWLISFLDPSDQFQLVCGLSQLLLALAYALYAWGRYDKFWAFLAVWLAAAGGGFIVLVYSRGQGSLAAKGALIVACLVLGERLLNDLKRRPALQSRLRAFIRLVWGLFRQPLLFTGWLGSAAVIGLALVRNLVMLDGRAPQIWAVVSLLLITALYALSARLFRQAVFVWLSGALLFIPWTILTHLGWLTSWQPDLPAYAGSWLALAWLLLGLNLLVKRFAPDVYARPLSLYCQILTPFALLFGLDDAGASRVSFGLAIGLYAFCAWLAYRRAARDENLSLLDATKFLYPALALLPVWCAYLLRGFLPAARYEHYGLLLLSFGVWGLLAGRWLERIAQRPRSPRAYGLPAYLTGYSALLIGTLLTTHLPVLLAMALLYAAVLMLVSAWIFRSALWLYPGSLLATLAWLIALSQANIPLDRRGWWLLGLAALYLALGWLLRRARLRPYGTAAIAAGFAVIALSLPFSSLDHSGALWGYAGAALLYSLSAFWLSQPLLLVLACALIPVAYASALQLSSIQPVYYGLLLFPGALLAFGLGWLADLRLGAWRDFPFRSPSKWLRAMADRLAHWWGLPLYALSLGLAFFAPGLTERHFDLTALNFFLLMLVYALAAYRFRSRFWLTVALLAGHLAAVYYLHFQGWWQYPEQAWLRFLPVTVLMAAAAIGLERWLKESPPLEIDKFFTGWSRPFYLFMLADILLGQFISLLQPASSAGMLISLAHAALIAVLASLWISGWLPYLSTFLGLVTLWQSNQSAGGVPYSWPVYLAWLALAYGLFGFGYQLLKRFAGLQEDPARWLSIWERSLQRSGMLVSLLAFLNLLGAGFDLVGWSVRALFGLPFRALVDTATIWMVLKVFSLIGLLYTAAAAVYRRLRLGYLSVGLLLVSWFLYAFYINIWDGLRQLQWYALPAGFYLLALGYLEWRAGQRLFARWLDYLAMLLMLGSLFWQTLEFGLLFAFLLICEGVASLWWGSARRQRRFFYTGIIAVMLAVFGQLLNALQSINQWLVFGLIGLALVGLAILVERKLETIKAWQKVLETWE
jgi:hypothetical protein